MKESWESFLTWWGSGVRMARKIRKGTDYEDEDYYEDFEGGEAITAT